ncbi:MAG TPA: preprotein translocase subunit SecG, partial [Acidobacteriota bacterium]|nr:preprotein translocase subunit SecG [Acidobacteriota bacterium]
VSALIIILHIIVCLILIFAVLLQSGKAADLAGAFGGGGSQTNYAARGSGNLLTKLTTASAILFMVTSLGLWILSGRGTTSVVGSEKAPVTTTAPQTKPTDTAPAAAPVTKPEQKTETQKPPVPAPPVKK